MEPDVSHGVVSAGRARKTEGIGSMPRLSSLDAYESAVKARRIADNTAIRLHTREWQDKRDRLAAEADAAWEKVQADFDLRER